MTLSLKKLFFFVSAVAIAFAVLKAKATTSLMTCELAFAEAPIEYFPTPLMIEKHDGLLKQRAPLNVYSLSEAYSKGIFPWVEVNQKVEWYSPPTRAILLLNNFKLNRTNKKILNNHSFKVTYNKDFEAVIRTAAETHTRNKGEPSWITDNFINAYIDFHRTGAAESIEVWQQGQLVGGLYGVKSNGVYYGESMFHKVSNASKVALFYLVEQLKKEGYQFMETQQLSDVMKSIGGQIITRQQFETLLHSKP